MTKIVLLAGASGKIGRNSERAFKAAGWTVRRFKRGTDMTVAARGVDVIVNGMNPPKYHDWANIIPKITKQVLEAAKANGCTVIIPGNLYNFGDNRDGEWSETTPHTPITRKGRIREEMEQAYRESGVQTIILRAGNYIDPKSEDDVMSEVTLRAQSKGKFTTAGKPDAVQNWCYLPDWARAAAALSDKRHELAQFVDVPFPGYSLSGTELKAKIEALTGRRLKTVQFPWVIMQLLSPVWEMARELLEMRYLFDLDHSLSDRRMKTLLPGFQYTPLDDALSAKLGLQTAKPALRVAA
ncbi:NAD-dependent epimerase/dehydratase family protein [Pseudoruegeria sp. HB172150]|uniref:NAD-dependent epimerase/dehydratase family protein n=1 Tax=Pseudoruegeria sp. HB172150 TaxID=2721164 RepID=UPI00155395D4|nr:NAD-dependent epimerase/dehydratase family protein [Pseudoruegeria sp. HB172150]